MINTKFLQYIPSNKQEEVYNQLLQDIYYFYYGTRPDSNRIKVINGNKWDLCKNNLELI